ncbi:MAG: hypothetical protein SGPRY_006224, partial [Prymnesium sp.]
MARLQALKTLKQRFELWCGEGEVGMRLPAFEQFCHASQLSSSALYLPSVYSQALAHSNPKDPLQPEDGLDFSAFVFAVAMLSEAVSTHSPPNQPTSTVHPTPSRDTLVQLAEQQVEPSYLVSSSGEHTPLLRWIFDSYAAPSGKLGPSEIRLLAHGCGLNDNYIIAAGEIESFLNSCCSQGLEIGLQELEERIRVLAQGLFSTPAYSLACTDHAGFLLRLCERMALAHRRSLQRPLSFWEEVNSGSHADESEPVARLYLCPPPKVIQLFRRADKRGESAIGMWMFDPTWHQLRPHAGFLAKLFFHYCRVDRIGCAGVSNALSPASGLSLAAWLCLCADHHMEMSAEEAGSEFLCYLDASFPSQVYRLLGLHQLPELQGWTTEQEELSSSEESDVGCEEAPSQRYSFECLDVPSPTYSDFLRLSKMASKHQGAAKPSLPSLDSVLVKGHTENPISRMKRRAHHARGCEGEEREHSLLLSLLRQSAHLPRWASGAIMRQRLGRELEHASVVKMSEQVGGRELALAPFLMALYRLACRRLPRTAPREAMEHLVLRLKASMRARWDDGDPIKWWMKETRSGGVAMPTEHPSDGTRKLLYERFPTSAVMAAPPLPRRGVGSLQYGVELRAGAHLVAFAQQQPGWWPPTKEGERPAGAPLERHGVLGLAGECSDPMKGAPMQQARVSRSLLIVTTAENFPDLLMLPCSAHCCNVAPVLLPYKGPELRELASSSTSIASFLQRAVKAGYEVCSTGLLPRDLLHSQAVESYGRFWQAHAILHNGERVGALWDLPGCFITSRVTLQTPNSMANRKASSVTMSVYSNGEMQMRKKDVPADCNWAGKYISQMDAHPLSEFLGEVARGVGQGVESLVCTLARKPLPVNAALLADARVLMRMRSGARARQADEMVRMLGGRVVERADMATHCVVSEGLRAHDLGDLREDLEICQALEVTVVEPSWVEAAAKIARTEREVNWNAVLVDSYVSPVMALLSFHSRWHTGRNVPSVGKGGAVYARQQRLSLSACPQAPVREEASNKQDARTRGASAGAAPSRPELATPLLLSLDETWRHMNFLRREQPDFVEERELRRAIELSMLDCAITLRQVREKSALPSESAEQVLGVAKGASPSEIRAAYRARVLAAHPDKGGSPVEFQRIERAYRRIWTGKDDLEEQELGELLHAAVVVHSARRGRDDASSGAGASVTSASIAEWSGKSVGEDVQAFSDFLFFVIGPNALLSDFAISVFDSISGGVEIYK